MRFSGLRQPSVSRVEETRFADVGGGGVEDIVRDLHAITDRLIDLPRLLDKSEYASICSELDKVLDGAPRIVGCLRVSRDLGKIGFSGVRYRDAKGIPVIPGLDDAAYAFDDLWREAEKWAFDDACSKCGALFALGRSQHALAPEMRLLRELDTLHREFSSRLHVLPSKLSSAERRFFGFIETARYQPLGQACQAFLAIANMGPDTPKVTIMSRLLRRISAVYDRLHANEVSERLRKI